jgi:hypothetical protein
LLSELLLTGFSTNPVGVFKSRTISLVTATAVQRRS